MLVFLKAPFLILHFSYYTLMTFLIMLSVILLSMLMILLYSKCDQTSDLWKQLELTSEVESDLPDTVDWGRKWLADFNTGKSELVLFDWSNNIGATYVKMDRSVLEEKSSFKMLVLAFSFKLDWGSYLISITKTVSKKAFQGALIRSMKFLSLEVALYLNKSSIGPCMETVVMSWLMPLVASRTCCINHKNRYTGLLVLHLLPS